ncbi:MAG: tRNA uridine-5-carboxymethylaminomethyl(34) synthesis enzyme MnmG [Eubacteriales bacterium]|nr:tRNA uridine-5-carboxymethylaminomethyl(34) synthesis enzyme MnmG [Eubacteriales bacterium]
MKTFLLGEYDVAVVGAGHAGIEAALACARMGLSTLMLTINLDGIALMACNPAIGGTSKGHLVREVDALGGEMGLAADATQIQRKMLNTSKGPAVQSLRAQADKKEYQRYMKQVAENTPNLDVRQGECTRILTRGGRVCGVLTRDGCKYLCRALVLATGVYLKGKVIIGEFSRSSGPSGLFPADLLSADLKRHDLSLMRFKTGTPARVNGHSLDFSRMTPQWGQPDCPTFSFLQRRSERPSLPCYLTYTNAQTHRIVQDNLHRSPLYSGMIEGTGPRYCPSIEDKVVRFADKPSHQVFIEPEGQHTAEMYVQGMSSSLPIDVQVQMLRTLPGLENMALMRPGYAIEYDLIDPTQLDASLGVKHLPGLFTAGQINGSSGYEEAAAQGVVAGINAAQYVRQEPPLILDRTQAYVGVLIDDLVTKGTREPYRMMTSRAEYRLVLRQDNADERLTQLGRNVGLVSDERYDRWMRKQEEILQAMAHLESTRLPTDEALRGILSELGETPPEGSARLSDCLKRPRVTYSALRALDTTAPALGDDAWEQAEISIKYDGYISRQQREIARQKKLETLALPPDLPYAQIGGLRKEAAQKLAALTPRSLGQAGRISGVSPADIAVLLVYLEKLRR